MGVDEHYEHMKLQLNMNAYFHLAVDKAVASLLIVEAFADSMADVVFAIDSASVGL